MFDAPLISYKLDICIVATVDTNLEGWIGAVLRNNFLYACKQVMLEDQKGISLFDCITKVPLPSTHPLYKELENGFPQAYYIFPQPYFGFGSSTKVDANTVITFSLVLIGEAISKMFLHFVDAIRIMCKRGFGAGMQTFSLVEITENSLWGERRLIATGDANLATDLLFPICYKDFETNGSSHPPPCISIKLETPVALIKLSTKGKASTGYQGKSNAFPSFYQLVRSAAHRLVKLNTLYALPHDDEYCKTIDDTLDDYLLGATLLEIEYANIRRINLWSTYRKEKEGRIPLRGYVGELAFRGNYQQYLPLLYFMEYLGVGNELTYGFGRYIIRT